MNPSNSDPSPRAGTSSSPVTVASLVIVVSFFLPYVTIWGKGVAGYQLHEVWKLGAYLWSIPALAAVALVATLLGKGSPNLARLVGIVPFAFLAVAIFQGGKDVLSALSIGGYGTLIPAGFLIWHAPRFIAKSPGAVPAAPSKEPLTHEAGDNR